MKKLIIYFVLFIWMHNSSTAQLFTNYTSLNTGSNHLISNFINDIKIKEDGTIVFCTNSGLSFLSDGEWENINHNFDMIDIDINGHIWGSNWYGQTLFYNNESLAIHQLTVEDCDGPCPIFSCNIDNLGNVWFDSAEGLFMYDGIEYLSIEGSSVQASLMENGAGNDIWFAGYGGIEVYNGISWELYDDVILDSWITSLCYDLNGHLWFGTNNGIAKFDGENWSTLTEENGLLNNEVLCISQEIDERVWVVTTAGICIFNGSEWEYIDSLGEIDFSEVTSINKTPEGIIWFSTNGSGAYSYDGVTVQNIFKGDGLSDGMVMDVHITDSGKPLTATYSAFPSIFEDDSWHNITNIEQSYYAITQNTIDGNIWYGGSNDVYEYDGENWITHQLIDNSIIISTIWDIVNDENGNIWVGTNYGGVFKYDGSIWLNYTTDDGLLDSDVFSIDYDSEGKIFFGTRSGLNVFDGNIWTSYTTVNGLPDNRIRDVFVENDTHIWLATDHGLSLFNGMDFTNYYKSDGLYGNDIKAIDVDMNGYLWIACEDGINGGVTRYRDNNWLSFSEADGLLGGGINDLATDEFSNVWMATNRGVSFLNAALIGVESMAADKNYYIFPNPSSHYIMVNNKHLYDKEIEYQIVSSRGENISSRKKANPNSSIDISMLPSGMYFMIVFDNERTNTYKFIKQ